MEERDQIAQLKHAGASQQEIAQSTRSGVHRPFVESCKRNGCGSEYFAAQAQHRAANRRRDRPLVRKMEKPEIRRVVRNCLKQYWSPEQIAGRLRLELD